MKPASQPQPKAAPLKAAEPTKPEPVRTSLAMFRDDGAWTLERYTTQGDRVLKREVIHAKDIKPIVLEMAQNILENTPL